MWAYVKRQQSRQIHCHAASTRTPRNGSTCKHFDPSLCWNCFNAAEYVSSQNRKVLASTGGPEEWPDRRYPRYDQWPILQAGCYLNVRGRKEAFDPLFDLASALSNPVLPSNKSAIPATVNLGHETSHPGKADDLARLVPDETALALGAQGRQCCLHDP